MQESKADLRLIRFAENIGIKGKCEEFIDLDSISALLLTRKFPSFTNINLHINICGTRNSGSYSLITQYIAKTFSYLQIPKSQRNVTNTKTVSIGDKKLNIICIAASSLLLRQYLPFSEKFCCVILVYDITSWNSFAYLEKLRRCILLISDKKPYENFPFVVIGNKIDKGNKREVSYEIASEWCRKNGNMPFYETSAKDNINVDIAFEMAVKKGGEWHTKRLIEWKLNMMAVASNSS